LTLNAWRLLCFKDYLKIQRVVLFFLFVQAEKVKKDYAGVAMKGMAPLLATVPKIFPSGAWRRENLRAVFD